MFANLLSRVYMPNDAMAAKDFDIVKDTNVMLTSEKVVPPPDLDTWYRVSGLGYMCARQEVLCHQHKVTRIEKTDARKQRTFDFGTAFHSMVQNEWFGKWGWLVGDWKCLSCGKLHLNKFKPSACDGFKLAEATLKTVNPGADIKTVELDKAILVRCNSQEFVYVEAEFKNEEYKISGHPDGTLVKDGTTKQLELKTSNSRYFKQIFEVMRDAIDVHKDQINMYMWMSKIQKGVIAYFDKDESQMVQFPQNYAEQRVEKNLGKVESVRKGLKTGDLPGRICDKIDCSRAKTCPVRKQCFEVA